MRRDTTQRIRELTDPDLPIEERIARAAAQSAQAAADRHASAGHIITEPQLPSSATTDLVTVTTDELHDLTYTAASNVLRRTSIGDGHARQLAARVAIEAQQIARANGWTSRGADPRPAAQRG